MIVKMGFALLTEFINIKSSITITKLVYMKLNMPYYTLGMLLLFALHLLS